MVSILRKIITIDEEKCDGCGGCVPSCAEGALKVIDGKARLMKDSYCDGLGACLGECPQGALAVVEMEVEPFDEAAAMAHTRSTGHQRPAGDTHAAPGRPQVTEIPLCPSIQMRSWDEAPLGDSGPEARSELRQWPVQLHLIPPSAPFLKDSTLTLVADCVPFADPNMHAHFLRDSAIAVGCPKLDDGKAYISKLAQVLQASNTPKLRVAYMEVPCCRGLVYIAQQAVLASGLDIPLEPLLVNIRLR